MIRTKLAALLLIVFSPFIASNAKIARADDLVIASWNLENLFDTADDPKVEGDEEYTPDAKKHWTKERLEIKLKNLAAIISKMNDGKGPDVLGVCEIENRKVVELLVEKLRPLHRKYEIVHKDSPSERGIDCAIIYDSGVFSLADSKFHHVDARNTRDIVEAKLRRNDSDLYVFMDHWPSRYHDESFRNKAADVARQRIDEIVAADAKADIILLGDFNDHSTDEALRDHLRAASTSDNLAPMSLFDTTAAIAEAGKGTFVYENKWDLLDHIIVSAGLLDPSGFQWKKGSSKELEYRELLYQPKYPGVIARPSTSYTKDDFHKNGQSDHLPLNCILMQ